MSRSETEATAWPIDHSQRDADLAHKGWIRRFIVAPPRIEEVVDLYENAGYEVRLEPIADEEVAEECHGCELAKLARVVYTRRFV